MAGVSPARGRVGETAITASYTGCSPSAAGSLQRMSSSSAATPSGISGSGGTGSSGSSSAGWNQMRAGKLPCYMPQPHQQQQQRQIDVDHFSLVSASSPERFDEFVPKNASSHCRSTGTASSTTTPSSGTTCSPTTSSSSTKPLPTSDCDTRVEFAAASLNATGNSLSPSAIGNSPGARQQQPSPDQAVSAEEPRHPAYAGVDSQPEVDWNGLPTSALSASRFESLGSHPTATDRKHRRRFRSSASASSSSSSQPDSVGPYLGSDIDDDVDRVETAACENISGTNDDGPVESSHASPDSDRGSFGQVVYNPDGSAYVIEDQRLGDQLSGSFCRDDWWRHGTDLPRYDAAIVDSHRDGGISNITSAQQSFPKIFNVAIVRRSNETQCSGSFQTSSASAGNAETSPPSNGNVTWYRAVDSENFDESGTSTDLDGVQVLMCLACKLSFATWRSFIVHASGEHKIQTAAVERSGLSSALIQVVGEERTPMLTYIQRCSSPHTSTSADKNLSRGDPSDSKYRASMLDSSVDMKSGTAGFLPSTTVDADDRRQKSLSGETFSSSQESVDIWRRVNGATKASAHEVDDDVRSGGSADDSEVITDGRNVGTDVQVDSPKRSKLPYKTALPLSFLPDMPDVAGGSFVSSPSSALVTSSSQLFCGSGALYRGADEQSGSNVSIFQPIAQPAVQSDTPTIGGGGIPLHGLQIPVQQQQPTLPATSRNSCKTLKCPKCNWHYKYQETLEIHMREKHPETDAACVYCAGGGAHPRLARGESYTCGYKPYRCDVCNYSTTTKGNLSIHLQSDKHTNNVQELQQNAVVAAGTTGGLLVGGCPSGNSPTASMLPMVGPSPSSIGVVPSTTAAVVASMTDNIKLSATPPLTPGVCFGPQSGLLGQQGKQQQSPPSSSYGSSTPGKPPKPSWRCDFCGYETTEARNLRIHMTSEKHAQNLLALQQSAAVSVAQQLAMYGPDAAAATAAAAVAAVSMLGLGGPGAGPTVVSQGPQAVTVPGQQGTCISAVATSGRPFDTFLAAAAGLLPISSCGPMPLTLSQPATTSSSADCPIDLTKNPEVAAAMLMTSSGSGENRRSSFDPDESPCMFRCTICDVYSTDHLEALQAHVQLDRSSNGADPQPPGVAVVQGGTYLCTLCQYRTSLKANFQLHCKTDKHLQRLQLVNHVQEGCLDGSTQINWDRPLPASAVEVRCAACDYRTNSVYRLQMHAASPSHAARATLFRFLCASEAAAMLAEAAKMKLHPQQHQQQHKPVKRYRCIPCGGLDARSRLGLIEHAQSAQHIQNEAVHMQSISGADAADYFRLLGTIFVVDCSSATTDISSSDAVTVDNDVSNPSCSADTATVAGQSVTSSLQLETSQLRRVDDLDSKSGPKLSQDETTGAGRGTHHQTLNSGSSEHTGRLEAGRFGAESSSAERTSTGTVACILCMECIETRDDLQRHLLTIHKVKPENLQSILLLADTVSGGGGSGAAEPLTTGGTRSVNLLRQHSNDESSKLSQINSGSSSSTNGKLDLSPGKGCSQQATANSTSESGSNCSNERVSTNSMLRMGLVHDEAMKLAIEASKEGIMLTPSDGGESSSTEADCTCHTCSQSFSTFEALYAHQTELGHLELTQTPTGPGYLCWQRGCRQYFRTAAGVQAHHRDTHAVAGEYKFQCTICGLSFRTASVLQTHAYCHEVRAGRSATDCLVCGQTFASVDAVHRHVDSVHTGNGGDLERYRASLAAASSLALLGGASTAVDGFVTGSVPSSNPRPPHGSSDIDAQSASVGEDMIDCSRSKQSHVELDHSNGVGGSHMNKFGASGKINDDECKLDENSNSNMAETMETDALMDSADQVSTAVKDQLHTPAVGSSMQTFCGSMPLEGDYTVLKYKCHRCKVAFAKMNQLSAHNRTPAHRQGGKTYQPTVANAAGTSMTLAAGTCNQALEKYRDPNRPFKCEVCLESFTQKNILLVHYNSVSHLHRLKQQQQKQQQQQMELMRQQQHDLPSKDFDGQGLSSSDAEKQVDNNQPHPLANHTISPARAAELDSSCNQDAGRCSDSSVHTVERITKDKDVATLSDKSSISSGSPLKPQQLFGVENKLSPNESLNSSGLSSPTKALINACASQKGNHEPSPAGHSKTPVQKEALNFDMKSKPEEHHPTSSTQRHSSASVRPDVDMNRSLSIAAGMIPPTNPMTSMAGQNNLLLQQQQMQMLFADMLQQQLFAHQNLGSFLPMTGPGGMLAPPGLMVPGAAAAMLSGITAKNPLGDPNASHVPDKDQGRAAMATSQSSAAGDLQPPHNGAHGCSKCSATFASAEHLQQHLPQCASAAAAASGRADHSQPMPRPDPVPSALASSFSTTSATFKSRMQQVLLENFGFECAMQFNEFRQKNVTPKQQTADSSDQPQQTSAESKPEVADADCTADDKAKDGSANNGSSLPELKRSTCSQCSKEFSSIWVLKAHEEEVHHVVLSAETVATFAKEFRDGYEKRHPTVAVAETKPTPTESASSQKALKKNELPANVTSQSGAAGLTAQSPDAARMSRVTSGQLAADLAAMQQAAAQLMQLPLLMGMMGGVGAQTMPGGAPGMMPVMMPLGAELFGLPPGFAAMMDPSMMMFAHQQQQQQQRMPVPTMPGGPSIAGVSPAMPPAVMHPQPPPQQIPQQVKSARTRINDDQLAVLRAHFDINNSPSEEQIRSMSERTGLPPKVIKHWFRNTLFKERQRNKDSPYNFSVPPATTLNLEDYERTAPSTKRTQPSTAVDEGKSEAQSIPSKVLAVASADNDRPLALTLTNSSQSISAQQQEHSDVSNLKKTDVRSMPVRAPLPPSPLFPDMTAAALASMVHMSPGFNPVPGLVASNLTPTRLPTAGPVMMPAVGGSGSGNEAAASAAGSGGHGSSERRANRTRFTNQQIQVLHDFFEKNAYPKDDELEALSRMLDLSPRVIVVWFQNARQKVRKNNESQSLSTSSVDATSDLSHGASATLPLSLTASQSLPPATPHHSQSAPSGDQEYRCKRCPASFQQFYELIKHQRAVCYKDESGGIGAGDSDSSQDEHDGSDNDASQSSMGSEPTRSADATPSMISSIGYHCDRCEASFTDLHSWKEHQSVHESGSGTAGSGLSLTSQDQHTPTAMSANEQEKMALGQSGESADDLASQRNWCSDDGGSDDLRNGGSGGGSSLGGDKRMRTTILPEQLDYLYHKYQADCNPSRKQLDAIAAHVGLKKRVVQVWFQNTRARERKGQYRAHQQLIHKRCPFCKALFRARTALEAHLATKHPDEMAHTDINVDSIPDEPASSATPTVLSSPPVPPAAAQSKPIIPNGPFAGIGMTHPLLMAAAANPLAAAMGRAPGPGDLVQANIQRLYEDSFRRYIDELSHASHPVKIEQPPAGGRFTGGDLGASVAAAAAAATVAAATAAASTVPTSPAAIKLKADDAPLDLSTSSSSLRGAVGSMSRDEQGRGGMRDDLSSMGRRASSQEDTRSESRSETNDDYGVDYSNTGDVGSSNPASPAAASSKSHLQTAAGTGNNGGTPGSYIPGKRYRTQMSSMQIRVMKAIFAEYRTPTMSECEALGREISLPRRVVQVWFQNARAKEKKIGMPCGDVSGSASQSAVLTNPLSESCDLCGVRFTAQHTIQDHLFTRNHIDRVKAMVCSQRDPAAMDDSNTPGRTAGSTEFGQRTRKFSGSSSARMDVDGHHVSQHRPSVPNGSLMMMMPHASTTSHGSGGTDKRQTSGSGSSKVKQDQSEAAKTTAGGLGDLASVVGGAGASGPLATNFVNSAAMNQLFGGHLAAAGFPMPSPSDMVGMMPYFYPGITGFYPGAAIGVPFMQPPLLPGPESMFMIDPANFGTPLAMLQIPGRAIQRIQEKLSSDPECTLTYYSQDCRHFSELRKLVSSDDAAVARRATVDVGYICRRCQIVYPGRSTCAAHQESVCYRDAAASGSSVPHGSIVKLEQMQYECVACRGNFRFSTAAEYKAHCGHDSHRSAASAWLRTRSHDQNRPSSSTAAPTPEPTANSSLPSTGASTPLLSSSAGEGQSK